MLSKTFTLLFYLKKPKNYDGGKTPIYMRFTINGQRVEIATKRECEPENAVGWIIPGLHKTKYLQGVHDAFSPFF